MKKVGKLNGKVVVSGDKNLVTANQIHYEESEGNINLSERKDGELKSVAGAPDDFLSYRYFKNGDIDLGGNVMSVIEFFQYLYSMITELDVAPNHLTLPFIMKIKTDLNSIITEKNYQIKFIDIMYDEENLDGFDVLGIMIPKYLDITLISSAPSFGNIYPEYNKPFFDCMRDIFRVIDGDEGADDVKLFEKALQPFEITREEFLNIGI